jgi:hypothetical protein
MFSRGVSAGHGDMGVYAVNVPVPAPPLPPQLGREGEREGPRTLYSADRKRRVSNPEMIQYSLMYIAAFPDFIN